MAERNAGPRSPGRAPAWRWLRDRLRRRLLTTADVPRQGGPDDPGGGLAGVREPRRPNPSPLSDAAARDLP
ncbi:MAG: hypothetical protein J2P24_06750 [Streptosporangiales bacterium]|nr:hypothetical protein [Streptosporangiales bacterium]MBO0892662.1 hypothetical protein [Acidothermales bacterium]